MKRLDENLSQLLKRPDRADQEAQDSRVIDETDPRHTPQQDVVTPDQLLLTVIENAPIVLFTLDHAGIFTMSEGHGLQALGLRSGELVGTSFFDFHKDTPNILNKFLHVLDGNALTSINKLRDLYFETHYMPLLDSDSSVSGVIGVATNITERIKVEQALQVNERKMRTMIEQATDLILILDANAIFTYASPSHQRIMGYDPEDLVGKNILDYIHPDDKARTLAIWEGAFEASGTIVTIECRLRHANGSWVTIEAIARNCLDDPSIQGFIVNARDVGERSVVQEQLHYQLLHDNLTDLPNRTLLLEILGGIIQKTPEQMLALIVLDLNRFRDINDTFGHIEGDRLLANVASRLREAICDCGTVASLGGDEFAIMLPTESAEMLSERLTALKTMLEEPFVIEGYSLQMDACMGISLYPTHGEDSITLLRRADVAMFAAKRAHLPFVYYESEHDQNSAQRLELMSGLRHAVLANEFMLYYQPKAQTSTGTIRSVEALIRWQHPARGLIFPDHFIHLAEQTGFITALTLWTVERAMQQYNEWQSRGIELEIAVNLSMWDLHDVSFPTKIAALFERYGVPTYRIRMEVTESSAMADPDLTISVLKRLTALGIFCSIDDFGTGYSSLTYLTRLPIDELKIDRSFIQHITDTPANESIVSSTITMAHSLGLQVVAEGVEDANTLELLDGLGCDIAQGYYLSRPLPPDDFVRWLQVQERSFAAC